MKHIVTLIAAVFLILPITSNAADPTYSYGGPQVSPLMTNDSTLNASALAGTNSLIVAPGVVKDVVAVTNWNAVKISPGRGFTFFSLVTVTNISATSSNVVFNLEYSLDNSIWNTNSPANWTVGNATNVSRIIHPINAATNCINWTFVPPTSVENIGWVRLRNIDTRHCDNNIKVQAYISSFR